MIEAIDAAAGEPGAGSPTAARAIVAALVGHGIDRVYCVAGESYLGVLDALYDEPTIDVVTCRHEGSAGFAAVADAKLTRRPGVVLVNRGPGATNASIAVHAAWQDATSLVLLVGHVCRSEIGRRVFQELDCEKTFAGMAKAVWAVYEPERAAEAVARALRVAASGTPGPAVVVLPEDILSGPGGLGLAAPACGLPARPHPVDVDRVAALLRDARRPILIAGDRLGSAAGRATLRRLAHAWTVPVAVSNKRQDLFPNDDAHYAGHLNIATQPAQWRLVADADLVLAVGTRLDSITTQGHRVPAAPWSDQPLVHVYPDADHLGTVHTPAVVIAADPTAFLEALADRAPTGGSYPAGQAGHAGSDDGASGGGHLASRAFADRSDHDSAGSDPAQDRIAWVKRLRDEQVALARWQPVTAGDGVVFGAIVAAVDRLAPPDAVFTVDAGNFTSWVHRYLALTAHRRLLGIASSAMGFGIPGALGASLREPGRLVIAFVGDGGFLMTGTELATAVSRRARLVVIVADNASYGTIRQHQERAYPGRVVATDLANPDFCRMAEAFGARGLAIQSDDDIEPALREAFSGDGPAVVAVRTSLEWISAYQRMDGLVAAHQRSESREEST